MSLPSRITRNLLIASPLRTSSSHDSILRATNSYKNINNNTVLRSFKTTTRNMGVTAVKSVAEFKTIISSNDKVVIDCWATWCGPCRAISPIFEKLSDKYTDVTFIKVDVDDVEDLAQELGIKAMPTFFSFHNGEKLDSLVGANPGGLEKLIAAAAEK